jgi:hypothetical protein
MSIQLTIIDLFHQLEHLEIPNVVRQNLEKLKQRYRYSLLDNDTDYLSVCLNAINCVIEGKYKALCIPENIYELKLLYDDIKTEDIQVEKIDDQYFRFVYADLNYIETYQVGIMKAWMYFTVHNYLIKNIEQFEKLERI